jgi:hypothetical protein
MMTPKTVYLLFPTGGGSNHLGNMLSLTPGFKPRFKAKKDYETELLGKYLYTNQMIMSIPEGCIPQWESTSVHFHLTDTDYVLNHPGISIVCDHVNIFKVRAIESTAWKVCESDLIVLSTYPEPGSFMYDRITQPNWFGRHDPPENYNISDFKKLTNVTVKQFDIDQYASAYGFEYTRCFFKDNFDIVLSDTGRELHRLWWNNIHTKLHGPEIAETVEELVPDVEEVKQPVAEFNVNKVLDIYRP